VNRQYSYVKHTISFLITVMLLAAIAGPVAAQPPVPSQPSSSGDSEGPELGPEFQSAYVPGEILVKFKPTVGLLGAQSRLAAQDLQVTGAVQSIEVLKVEVEPGQELDTIAELQRDPNVLYAEPNYIAFAFDTIPNDPQYGVQWGLPKISAPAAWDVSTGSSDVVIAVVDTGIDLDHPDLSCPGKLMTGYNFVSPAQPPDDDHGHGTHVAGIAAACTNNATGVAGLAWGARLMPVKVLGSSGSGSYDDVAAGITYAADHGADVINLSLGGVSTSSTMANAVEYAHDEGALVVAAAGNCAQGGYQCNNLTNPIIYPGAYPTTVAVAATDSNDNWATFSEHHPYVDVAAPGVSIYSTLPGSYNYQSGTSMATPFVSGLAALIWSLDSGLSHDQVRSYIETTADDLGTPGKDDYFGYGRINAWRALGTVVNLQTSPTQVRFFVDDDSGPFPSSAPVDVTTTSSDPINWAATISPSVGWLEVVPPASGTVSAASSDSFTLVATRPPTYGTFNTSVIVTGTTSSGSVVASTTTDVRIDYVSDLYQIHLPVIVKNTTIN